jgi:hypothetical protein
MWAKTLFKLLVCAITIIPASAWATADSVLVNDLRIKLGQTTAANSNWTDAQLVRCFNMAQAYISALGRAIETDTTAGGGALRIATPSDFITLKGNAYLWRNGQEVRPIPKVSMDSLSAFMDYMQKQNFGVDRFVIAEDAGVVMVAPVLSSADSVRYSYYGKPTTFVDDSTTNSFSDEWQQVLIEAAHVIALQKINSPMLPMAIQERDKMISAMFQSLTLRPQLGSRATP